MHSKHVFKLVFHDIIQQIEDGLEKYDGVTLSTLEIQFKFIEIPTGGAYSTSRERLIILNKTSVVTIKNVDMIFLVLFNITSL